MPLVPPSLHFPSLLPSFLTTILSILVNNFTCHEEALSALRSTSHRGLSFLSGFATFLIVEVQQKVWSIGHLRRSPLTVVQRFTPSSKYSSSSSPRTPHTYLRLPSSPHHNLSFILHWQLKSFVTAHPLPQSTHHLPRLSHITILSLASQIHNTPRSVQRPFPPAPASFHSNPLVYIDERIKISNQPKVH